MIKETNVKSVIAKLPKAVESSDKKEGKKAFHTRFQQINGTTIQETNEFGDARLFHLNKEKGVWEVEGNFPLKIELRVLGKDLFNVTEIDGGIRIETLYSSARKIQETFIRGSNGKDCLRERRDDDLNGISDHQFFDENERLMEERVSENNALRKWIIDGEVMFDTTKSSKTQFNRLFERSEAGKYAEDLGDTKTIKALIGFLTPEQCAEVFQTSINRKKREALLKIWDENSSGGKAMEFLKSAKTLAAYKEHPLGYDLDSMANDIQQPLVDMSKKLGIPYESESQIKTNLTDQAQKTIVPFLILDAIRRNPKKCVTITMALRNKGKAFLPTNQVSR